VNETRDTFVELQTKMNSEGTSADELVKSADKVAKKVEKVVVQCRAGTRSKGKSNKYKDLLDASKRLAKSTQDLLKLAEAAEEFDEWITNLRKDVANLIPACKTVAESYEQWLKDNVFSKWDMTSSGFDYPDEIKARMAAGYLFDSATMTLTLSPDFAKPLYWGNPCGGMYSTTADILKYATHITLKNGLLSQNGFEHYFMNGALFSDGVSSYGRAGWEIAVSNGHRILTKEGTIGGFCSNLAIIPELKLGVFLWANVQSTMTYASARTLNILVPAIMEGLMSNQKKELPSIADEILGTYSTNGQVSFVIKKGDDTATTGLLHGTVGSENTWFEYDKKTTSASNIQDGYFFRYFMESPHSCIYKEMGGDNNALILFQKVNGAWTAHRYDAGSDTATKNQ